YITVEAAGSAPLAAFTADQTNITEGGTINFTDQSTNEPTSWSWDFGDGSTSTDTIPSHTYNIAGSYTVELTVTNDYGSDTETKTDYITVESGVSGTTVVEVTNPTTGQIWMDRNLGASQAATSSTDADAYGDLYQWGRGTDGHEKRNSGITSKLSYSNTPGHGDFITSGSDANYDWRSPQNDDLWQGVNGTNNPCPSGYRLPTDAELDAERQSWSSNDAAGAYASPLKLPMAGYRNGGDGSLGNVGSYSYYWSSTIAGVFSRRLSFDSSDAAMYSFTRVGGLSVRCLKD
ncbi:MAG: PKD domain-containing protein, partial [Salinivirgaceae bacterium]